MLAARGEELEEADADGFADESKTLYAGNLGEAAIVQVTSAGGDDGALGLDVVAAAAAATTTHLKVLESCLLRSCLLYHDLLGFCIDLENDELVLAPDLHLLKCLSFMSRRKRGGGGGEAGDCQSGREDRADS